VFNFIRNVVTNPILDNRNQTYVIHTKTGIWVITFRSDVSTSFTGILNHINGIFPHIVAQRVEILLEAEAVFSVGLKVTRHDGVQKALGNVLVDQSVELSEVLVETAEGCRARIGIEFAAIFIVIPVVGFELKQVIGTLGRAGGHNASR